MDEIHGCPRLNSKQKIGSLRDGGCRAEAEAETEIGTTYSAARRALPT